MTRRITQSTFDEAVKENMEEFEMEMEEALSDTIKQFEGQGINLDNIDTSGGIGMEALNESTNIIKSSSKHSSDEVVNALKSLQDLCNTQNKYLKRNRNILLHNGCVHSLYAILQDTNSSTVVKDKVMETIIYLTKTEEYRDYFEPGGSKTMQTLIHTYLNTTHLEKTEYLNGLHLALKLCRIVAKSEKNKVALMNAGLDRQLISILTNSTLASKLTETQSIFHEACLCIKELCLHNDIRVQMSCAFENGKVFIQSPSLLLALSTYASSFELYPLLTSYALIALKTLATHEEAIDNISKYNIVTIIQSIFIYYQSSNTLNKTPENMNSIVANNMNESQKDIKEDEHNEGNTDKSNENDKTIYSVLKSCLMLLRNICVDDRRKQLVVDHGLIESILFYLNQPSYFQDAGIVEYSLATLSNISLRSAPNSQRIYALDLPKLLEKSMRIYASYINIQRYACSLIRNIAARYPDSHQGFLDGGLEPLIRLAGMNPRIVDDAYGALRDLKCDIKLVKIDSNTGKVSAAYEHFGSLDNTQDTTTFSTNTTHSHDHSHTHDHDDHNINECCTATTNTTTTDSNSNTQKKKLNFNPVFEESNSIIQRIQQESHAPF